MRRELFHAISRRIGCWRMKVMTDKGDDKKGRTGRKDPRAVEGGF